MLTRAEILKVTDLQTDVVSIPEWGGDVLVRGLTGKERDQFESSIVEMKGKVQSVNLANVRAKLVSLCVVGEDGERLFGDSDAEELGKKSARALQRIFEVAQKLSGLSGEDIEELTKN